MSGPFAERLPNAQGAGTLRIWLKSAAYTQRLLLGEAASPWASGAHYLAYFSQAHALLKPDVAVLEVGDLYDAWAAAHGDWVESIGAKRRKPASALRRLIEPDAPRQLLAEVVEAVLAHLRGQTPLVLAMPSPRRWIHHANRVSGSTEFTEVTGDDVEDGAMYIADLLRAVSAHPLSGVLLEEAQSAADFVADDLPRYQSIINVIGHYRWSAALRLPAAASVTGDALAGFDAVIAAAPDVLGATATACGRDITALFVDRAPAALAPPVLVGRQFYFAELAPGLRPESVLDTLKLLRGQ
jgi:hypothetical protein